MNYDDAYPTCSETHVTLRVFPGELGTPTVTSALGLEPTSTQLARQRVENPPGPASAALPAGWFLSSEGIVASKDARRHLDWLLDQLVPRAGSLLQLRSRGASMDVSCFWASAHGHGGPTVSSSQSSKLAALGLDLWFDVYSDG